MKKYIPFGLAVILIGLLLVPLFATATLIPSYTYYSDGAYDGELWYSANSSSGVETLYEQNSILPFDAETIVFDTDRLAQTFLPTVTQTLTKVSLPLYRQGDPGTLWVSLCLANPNAITGEPVVPPLVVITYDASYIPTDDNGTWIDFGLSYPLTAGVEYAVMIQQTDNTGTALIGWMASAYGYANGEEHQSINSGTTWPGSTDINDLCFKQYGVQTTYSQARDSTIGNTSAGTSNRVGQWYFPASGEYYIFREGLFFDTSNLITSDNIQSATLQVWMSREETSTDNFELTIVDGSSLNGPLQTSDYYELGTQTDNLGSVSTATMLTTGYTTITLNADGLEKISKTTYTKFGLRSSKDIAGTAPTGYEYIYLYSGKGEHPPILTVTYLIGGLGIPDEMLIDKVYVVSGFQDPKDELFVWQNTLRYDVNPTVGPAEYFVVQLYNSTDNLIAQTIVNRWGWTPLSIYLDNVTATTILPWKSDCYLVMTGSSLYGTPTNFDNYTYEVQSVDWRGVLSDKNTLLDIWCRATSNWMEDKNGLPRNTYMTTGATGTWSFDPLNPDGGPVFLEGIPYLDVARPNLFLIGSGDYTQGKTISGAYASGLYTAVWGTYWSDAFNDLASGWGAGLGGQWIIGGMLGGVIVMIGAVVRQKSADPNISLVVMGFGFVIALALGSIAMDVALVGTIIVLFVFLKQTFITTQ